ncbi:fructose-6-phosphate aldolase, partial [candidate division KSB1 bacterium]
MKIFIDTGNVDEIKEAMSLGVINGVTTNPTLLSREIERTGESSEKILKEICRVVQ